MSAPSTRRCPAGDGDEDEQAEHLIFPVNFELFVRVTFDKGCDLPQLSAGAPSSREPGG